MEQLVPLVAQLRRCRAEGAELEIRLGDDHGTRFAPGICRGTFDQLETDMIDCGSLEADPKWVEVVDYHYLMGRRKVRTRVSFDTATMEMAREHVAKEALATAVVRNVCNEDGRESCRVACSTEIPVTDPPVQCMPTHVRIKQRRRFRDRRDGAVVWSYELSRVWSASSRSAAEHMQHTTEPVLEAECELVDEGGAYLDARTDEQVAASLLMKARMLMGNEAAG